MALTRNRYSFQGKCVLITGGSRGLGLVLARKLAGAGARVAICARHPGELAAAGRDLGRRPAQILEVTCDLRDPAEVHGMAESVLDRFGRVDVLINNAGVIQVGPLDTMEPRDFEEAMRIHFWAPLYASLAVLPGMRERREGRIVNISSIGGKIAFPHLLPYTASKFALSGLSAGMRAELAREGILVTTVYPGLMRTGSPRNAFFKGRHRDEYAWFSILDSLPGLSLSAERAARRTLAACRRGKAEVVLSYPAKAAVALHGLFPNLTAAALAAVSRWLPEAGGIGSEQRRGSESESALTLSWLTALSLSAAERNNELSGDGESVEH
jgi:NAD(P)-dependent dehydrogenase (short-subunit alcohol dehydrogenase family)